MSETIARATATRTKVTMCAATLLLCQALHDIGLYKGQLMVISGQLFCIAAWSRLKPHPRPLGADAELDARRNVAATRNTTP